MSINRRDFLKFSAGAGLALSAGATPAQAAKTPELPPEAVGILYDATLCIGCKSCMVNCKKVNSERGGALYHKDTAGQIPYVYNEPDKIYDAPQSLSDKTLCIIKAHRNDGKEAKPASGQQSLSFHQTPLPALHRTGLRFGLPGGGPAEKPDNRHRHLQQGPLLWLPVLSGCLSLQHPHVRMEQGLALGGQVPVVQPPLCPGQILGLL